MTNVPNAARAYVDHLGRSVPYDGRSRILWRVSSYAVALLENSVLMVEPMWAKRWELPGGGVELQLQETLPEAARRECREETGYVFEPSGEPRFIQESFFLLRNPDRFCHSLMFAVPGTVGDLPDPGWRRDPAEIRTVRWVPLASLGEGSVHLPHLDILRLLGLV
jgi:8-oxo-dGTP pyrophosphatase MutT (NUDIX family)